ncbi:MAG: hypothetical protein R6X21_11900, partial [Candidatus Aminicenantes bacterium]
MKRSIVVLIISIFAATGWCLQETSKNAAASNQLNSKMDLLDFYRQYSSFTDPGEYAFLYDNLPGSLPDLCRLVKSQFIHLYSELPQYRELFPEERWDESLKYSSVKLMLEALYSYDARGLV